MSQQNRSKQTTKVKKKAFGLLEVVISIAISGVILLGSMNVALKGLQVVRLNEIKDISNGILLRSLELARSPSSKLNLTSMISDSAAHSYTINQDSSYTGTDQLQVLTPDDTTNSAILKCEPGSVYEVKIGNTTSSDTQAPFIICNQVLIQKISTGTGSSLQNDFSITSIVFYIYKNQQVKETLVSYRSEVKPTTP